MASAVSYLTVETPESGPTRSTAIPTLPAPSPTDCDAVPKRTPVSSLTIVAAHDEEGRVQRLDGSDSAGRRVMPGGA